MVNLDPAADHFNYQPVVDIRDLIQVDVSSFYFYLLHTNSYECFGSGSVKKNNGSGGQREIGAFFKFFHVSDESKKY